MFQVEDDSIFEDYEKAERDHPSQRKAISDERSVYESRSFRPPKRHSYGFPTILCDFGEARIGGLHQYAEIQPEVYKAPEILMQCEWGHKADIWNAACVVGLPHFRPGEVIIVR